MKRLCWISILKSVDPPCRPLYNLTNLSPKIQLNQYFAELLENPSGVRTLAQLIAFNNANPTLEEPAGFESQSV